ncbi:VanZ family protein [Neobacillus sp. LXY-4]|uniref:VanZ family protein n=1 Tax=Neobacillus sp. LXY-4 TaxID=3379826 RepID=UPI003EDFAAD8
MVLLRWFLRILPFAYMVAVWIMSSMPSDAIVELPQLSVDRFIKESLHLVEFAILYWLLVMAMLTTGKFSPTVSLICALIAGSYGIIDEIHQSFVPYRSATIIDAVKDWIGVAVSWYIIRGAIFQGKFSRIGSMLKKI